MKTHFIIIDFFFFVNFSGSKKILLGAIALEGMDLTVNPVDRKVVGVHGDKEEILVV